MGFDTQRIYANQAQMFVNGAVTMILFREGVAISNPDGSLPPQGLSRNVASIVLPTDVAREIASLLTTTIEASTGQAPGAPRKAK